MDDGYGVTDKERCGEGACCTQGAETLTVVMLAPILFIPFHLCYSRSDDTEKDVGFR